MKILKSVKMRLKVNVEWLPMPYVGLRDLKQAAPILSEMWKRSKRGKYSAIEAKNDNSFVEEYR